MIRAKEGTTNTLQKTVSLCGTMLALHITFVAASRLARVCEFFNGRWLVDVAKRLGYQSRIGPKCSTARRHWKAVFGFLTGFGVLMSGSGNGGHFRSGFVLWQRCPCSRSGRNHSGNEHQEE